MSICCYSKYIGFSGGCQDFYAHPPWDIDADSMTALPDSCYSSVSFAVSSWKSLHRGEHIAYS